MEPDDHPDDLDEDYAPSGYWAEENVGDDGVVGDVLPGAADDQAVPGLIPDDSDDDDYFDMEDGLEEARYMQMCRPVLKLLLNRYVSTRLRDTARFGAGVRLVFGVLLMIVLILDVPSSLLGRFPRSILTMPSYGTSGATILLFRY